ncbi:MAG TPA: hypothetical protein VFW49_06550 [Fluviicoccus sp.]|nr:hypothetical protein [Fluviicoccus sp.]
MTIQGIRNLQVTSRNLYVLALGLLMLSLAARSAGVIERSQPLAVAAFAFAMLGVALMLIVGRIRCPVCGYVYVGKSSKRYFTSTCRNCGRRAGDTA